MPIYLSKWVNALSSICFIVLVEINFIQDIPVPMVITLLTVVTHSVSKNFIIEKYKYIF